MTAPILIDTVLPLASVSEDAGPPVGAVGTLVSDFATPLNIVDIDGGAVRGIALTGAESALGKWWYSIDGGAGWALLGGVSDSNARLLAADAQTRVYFEGARDYNGTLPAALTFRAWDQNASVNGAIADVTINGGSTAFSSATDNVVLTVTAVNDAPRLTAAPMYVSRFGAGDPAVWFAGHGTQFTPEPLTLGSEGANSFLVSSGPYWVDPNHSTPGAGNLNLLAYAYFGYWQPATGIGGTTLPDLRDTQFTISVKGDNFVLPAGAHLYLWFQAIDPTIPANQGQSVNYANRTEIALVNGQWTTTTVQLSTNDADWIPLGSSTLRDSEYSISATVSDALSGLPQDFGIIALLGNGEPVQAASGRIFIDDIVFNAGPVLHSTFAPDPVPQRLNLAVNVADADNATFSGGSLAVSFSSGGTAFDQLSVRPAGSGPGQIGLLGSTVTYEGVPVGTVSGGGNGQALVVNLGATSSAAAVSQLIASLMFWNTSGAPAQSRTISIALNDGAGGAATIADEIRLFPTSAPVIGTDASENLRGGGLPDMIDGLGGNDVITGGAGADLMLGRTGNDSYLVDDPRDRVFEASGEGVDRVYAEVSYVLQGASEVEEMSTLDHAGIGAINLTGNEFANFIQGNAGNNVLNGGGGSAGDVLVGKEGNDTYLVNHTNDVVSEGSGGGFDRVLSGVSYVLAAASEVEELRTQSDSGTSAINLTGNEFANVIEGNAGDNILNGGAGTASDILSGRAGNDTYFVNRTSDVVNESRSEGFDRVVTGVTYRLKAGSEVEELRTANESGTEPINLTGNELANAIYGNAADNVLDGGGGTAVDTLAGSAGNDTYLVRHGGDVVIEATGSGSDRVYAAVSWVLTAGSEIETMSTADHAGTVAINLTGNEFANVIYGNAGANILNGGAGTAADNLIGRAGNDTYVVNRAGDLVNESAGEGFDRVLTAVTYRLKTGSEVEELRTTNDSAGAPINLTGNELTNALYGNAGDNLLEGGGGTAADALTGGAGNDSYFVRHAGDTVIEAAGGGADRVFATVSWVLSAGSEVETLSTADHAATVAINLTGNELANLIFGNAGANVLDGGAGTAADTLAGKSGNDSYYVNRSGDAVIEVAGEGFDRVLARTSYALAARADIEELRTADDAGTAAIDLTGNELANAIYGNAGDNVLGGGGGAAADAMFGLGGNDTYRVARAADQVTEASGAGFDRVLAAVSYTLAGGSEVEELRTQSDAGTDAIDLTGNELSNAIYGNAAANTLDAGGGTAADMLAGLAGNDTYRVNHAGDQVIEAAGGGFDRIFANVNFTLGAGSEIEEIRTQNDAGTAAINLTGNDFANTLYGNAGNNLLNGSFGSLPDTLIGLGGNDTYIVNQVADQVVEATGGGVDRILANVSYTLGSGSEVEELRTADDAGAAAIDLTGNELANAIFGNAGANVISGGGGSAADALFGLGGNDTYMVARAADQVTEASGAGFDRVLTAVSYTLAGGSEIEELRTQNDAGSDAINLTGNQLSNAIYGNAGANTLDGGGGTAADVLAGLGGNDTYRISHAGDQVIEAAGGGFDRVLSAVSYTLAAGSEVEELRTQNDTGSSAINFTGNELTNALYGNSATNVLNGGAGDDVLVGGFAADTLTGGSGADRFRFTAGSVARDVITDFSKSQGDILDLHDVLQTASGYNGTNAFSGGYLRFSNRSNGDTWVQFDSNGNANSFITLATVVDETVRQSDTQNYLL